MPLTKATTNVINLDKDTLVNGATVGRGGGDVSTNTALGLTALAANTTGYNNTAVGSSALASNTTGYSNTAIGRDALDSNTTGYSNTAVGADALDSNTTGANNTATGTSALRENTTGINNTAVGVTALYYNTTGSSNTAVGSASLLSNTTGANNTATGINALRENTIGIDNTATGVNALRENTTGENNSAFGRDALSTLVNYTNSTGIGYNAQVDGSNQIQLGSGTTTCYTNGAVQNRSDIRDKADVRDTVLGLEFVNELRPVDFKWDMREDYRPEAPKYVSKPVELEENASDEEKSKYAEELTAYNDYVVAKDKWLEDCKFVNLVHNGTHKRTRFHHGLIAQEVKAVIEKTGIDFGGFQDHTIKGGGDVLSLGYTELIGPLIKAVQELSAEVAELKAK